MAKIRSIVKFSGTISGITFVDSTAYGPHSRAKRGTYTPIILAEGMKVSSANLKEANLMAKIIFDAVNSFAPGFKDGRLWSRLVSVFRQQKKAGKPYTYKDFNEMEIRYDYTTSKQGHFKLNNEIDGLNLGYKLAEDMGYRLSLLRIATDETLLIPYPNEIIEIDVKMGDQEGSIPLDFTLLPKGSAVLYIFKCEQLWKGGLAGLLKGKGVKFFVR